MMNAIRGKMKKLMRNEKQRLKGISPHITAKQIFLDYSEVVAGFTAESVL
jgi:hypothetical protein